VNSEQPTGPRFGHRVPAKVAVCGVFVAANFMAIMDTTIVNVALPAIGRDFAVDTSGLSSVNVGYLVALAVCIPVSGWLGNRFGTRRTALGALLLFTVASALCATAGSLEALTGYRVVQGVGGGLLAPVGIRRRARPGLPGRGGLVQRTCEFAVGCSDYLQFPGAFFQFALHADEFLLKLSDAALELAEVCRSAQAGFGQTVAPQTGCCMSCRISGVAHAGVPCGSAFWYAVLDRSRR
jgi:hypothetical protein